VGALGVAGRRPGCLTAEVQSAAGSVAGCIGHLVEDGVYWPCCIGQGIGVHRV